MHVSECPPGDLQKHDRLNRPGERLMPPRFTGAVGKHLNKQNGARSKTHSTAHLSSERVCASVCVCLWVSVCQTELRRSRIGPPPGQHTVWVNRTSPPAIKPSVSRLTGLDSKHRDTRHFHFSVNISAVCYPLPSCTDASGLHKLTAWGLISSSRAYNPAGTVHASVHSAKDQILYIFLFLAPVSPAAFTSNVWTFRRHYIVLC